MNREPTVTDVSWPVTQPAAAADIWDGTFASDSGALPTQSRAWANALLANAIYSDVSRYFKLADGQNAVLPLFQRTATPPMLRFASSPPAGWGFGGPVSSRALSVVELAQILESLISSGFASIQIRPNPLDADLWDMAAGPHWKRLQRTAHVLDLAGGFPTVWSNRFRPRTRTAIRHAEKAGLEVVVGSESRLIQEFYGLLEQSFDRWARQQHEPRPLARWRARRRDPLRKFQGIAASLGGAFKIWLARKDGAPIAAILVLQDNNAHYTRGAMDEILIGDTSANLLLHCLAIESACKSGCSYYHMGETGSSGSLAQFKSRLGAKATPYAEYLYERLPLHRLKASSTRLIKSAIGFRDV